MGQRILVVDRDEPVTSSKVAAGLITPVYGSKFKIAENLSSTLPYARKFYWELEEQLGTIFFHHRRIARLFQTEAEAALWQRRKEEQGETLSEFHDALTLDDQLVKSPFGGFEMKGGGWLDLPSFLEAMRLHLLEQAAYAIATINCNDVVVDDQQVKWKNISADKIVFCQGWRGNRNRFFDWIPMNPAKGEILEFRCHPLESESRVLNSGGWILPTESGSFRAGSTYDHQASDEAPTDEGRRIISEKMKRMIHPDCEITNHQAAFRPTIRQSKVSMGSHPGFPRVAFFNGLGSKGVLNGPWFSKQLAEHLVLGKDIDEEVDIRRNFP